MTQHNKTLRSLKMALLSGALLLAFNSYAQYCIPDYTTGVGDNDYLDVFEMGSIYNATGPGSEYNDYTGMSTDISTGGTYSATITNTPSWGENYPCWIDYNQDGDFGDAGEYVGYVSLAAGATGSVSFTVPMTALEGPTRFRVRCIYGGAAPWDPCATYTWGETEDYTVNISAGVEPEPVGAVYLYSNVFGIEPWGSTSNSTAMTTTFGTEGVGWERAYFETADPGSIFSPDNCFVFMEGSDFMASEMETFLTANMTAIEDWVAAGGHLILNSAPNEGDGMSFGFGGTSLVYSYYTSTAEAVDGLHPIFNGPNLPAGTLYTGTSFGHARVTGTGLTNVMVDDFAPSNVVLAEKTWGDGMVMFGGMTTANWHGPVPNAQNLRANIFDYMSCDAVVPVCEQAVGLYVDGVTSTTADLHWDAADGASDYLLTVADRGNQVVFLKTSTTATDYTVTGLTPGWSYYFKVKTYCVPDALVAPVSAKAYWDTPLRAGELNGNVTIFPNPSDGQFTLSLMGLEGNAFDVQVYNSIGQVIYNNHIDVTSSENNFSINLGNAAAGIYQVRLTNNEMDLGYSIIVNE